MKSDEGSHPKPWRISASKTLYSDQWLTVHSDTCVTSEGQVIDPFHTFIYPDWVNVLPVFDDGSVGLALEYRHGRKKVTLGLIGGAADSHEDLVCEAPSAAVQRELAEETGYTASTVERVISSTANSATHTNMVHGFVATDLKLTNDTKLDPTEDVNFAKYNLGHILRKIESGEIEFQALHLVTLYAALRMIRQKTELNASFVRLLESVDEHSCHS